MANVPGLNLTHEEGLIIRLQSNQLEASTLIQNSQGYSVVVASSAGSGQTGKPIDIFGARDIQGSSSPWWRFWQRNKTNNSYVYYLIDTRQRKYEFSTSQPNFDNIYNITVVVVINYRIEDATTSALKVNDPLRDVVDRVENQIRLIVIAQDFIALHDVEFTLNRELQRSLCRLHEDLGINVLSIATKIVLPDHYYDAFREHVRRIKEEEDRRIELERALQIQRAEAQYSVELEKIKKDREQQQSEVGAEHDERQRQLDARIAHEKSKFETRIKQIEAEREAALEIEREKLDQLEHTLKERQAEYKKLTIEREANLKHLEDEAKHRAELRQEQYRREQEFANIEHHERLLDYKIDRALARLEKIGIIPSLYPEIMLIIQANPDENWKIIQEFATNILADKRTARNEARLIAQKSLDNYVEINRERIENQEISIDHFNRFMESLIATISGPDMAGYTASLPPKKLEDKTGAKDAIPIEKATYNSEDVSHFRRNTEGRGRDLDEESLESLSNNMSQNETSDDVNSDYPSVGGLMESSDDVPMEQVGEMQDNIISDRVQNDQVISSESGAYVITEVTEDTTTEGYKLDTQIEASEDVIVEITAGTGDEIVPDETWNDQVFGEDFSEIDGEGHTTDQP